MQADIGYRDYLLNPEKVKCPSCKKEHDFYKTCKCGMTWDKTMEEIQKPLREEVEKQQAEQENIEEAREQNKLVESGKLENTTTIKNDCKRNNQKLGRRKR